MSKTRVRVSEVLAPNEFYLVPFRSVKNDDEHAVEIDTFLDKLSKNVNDQHYFDGEDELEVDDIVAIKAPEATRAWFRARIEDVMSSMNGVHINVFLIDEGFHIRVGNVKRNVRWIPDNSSVKRIPGLAVRFKLFGLLPLEKSCPFDTFDAKVIDVISDKWTNAATNFTRKLTEAVFYCQAETLRMESDIILGHLELKLNDDESTRALLKEYGSTTTIPSLKDYIGDQKSPVSLSQLLTDATFAIDVGKEAHKQEEVTRPKKVETHCKKAITCYADESREASKHLPQFTLDYQRQMAEEEAKKKKQSSRKKQRLQDSSSSDYEDAADTSLHVANAMDQPRLVIGRGRRLASAEKVVANQTPKVLPSVENYWDEMRKNSVTNYDTSKATNNALPAGVDLGRHAADSSARYKELAKQKLENFKRNNKGAMFVPKHMVVKLGAKQQESQDTSLEYKTASETLSSTATCDSHLFVDPTGTGTKPKKLVPAGIDKQQEKSIAGLCHGGDEPRDMQLVPQVTTPTVLELDRIKQHQRNKEDVVAEKKKMLVQPEDLEKKLKQYVMNNKNIDESFVMNKEARRSKLYMFQTSSSEDDFVHKASTQSVSNEHNNKVDQVSARLSSEREKEQTSLSNDSRDSTKSGRLAFLRQRALKSQVNKTGGDLSSLMSSSDVEDIKTAQQVKKPPVRRHSNKQLTENTSKFVLVHKDPNARKVKAVHYLTDLKGIHQLLLDRMRVQSLDKAGTAIQQEMWPVVNKLYSLVVIGHNLQNILWGKHGGYLIPLLNQVLVGDDYSPRTEAPLVVILCPFWETVREIASKCCDISEDIVVLNDGIKMVIAVVYEEERKHALHLSNGCHVLITTPPSMLRMLSEECPLTSLQRCAHLVLEEADQLFELFSKQVSSLVQTFQANRRKFSDEPNQMIVSSNTWTPAIKQFIDVFMTGQDVIGPYIVIGNILEAIIYGKVNLESHVVDDNKAKLKKLKELVDNTDMPTVVFCSSREAVQDVQKNLDRPSIAIHDDIDMCMTEAVLQKWRRCCQEEAKTPLIISDEYLLNPLNLSRHEQIVHYDYPNHSELLFSRRFLHVKKTMSSYYSEEEEEEEAALKQASHIHLLISPSDAQMLKTVVWLLKRSKNSLSPELHELYRNFQLKHALQKTNSPLCDMLKKFGQCHNQRLCKARHFLASKMDSDVFGPRGCLVEYHVTHVVSASQYLVRLQKIKSESNRVMVDYTKPFLKLTMKLSLLKDLTEVDARKEVAKGKVFLVKGNDSCYKRAEIFYFKHEDLTLRLIDDGTEMLRKMGEVRLWKLPEEVSEEMFPRQSGEIILLDIKPKDKAVNWSLRADEMISEQLIENVKSTQKFCRSRYYLALNNTFWVQQVQLLKHLDSSAKDKKTTQWTPVFECKDNLKLLADDNLDHSRRLLQLCTQAHLAKGVYKRLAKYVQLRSGHDEDDIEENASTDDYQDNFKVPPEMVKPVTGQVQRAFLNLDNFNQAVFITNVNSPTDFCVRLVEFTRQLTDLEQDLSAYVECNNNVVDKEDVEIEEGQFCIAHWDDKVCSRVQILAIDQDNVCVEYIDYGNQAELGRDGVLGVIPQKFLDILPAQSIRCSLRNVKPAKNEADWSEEAKRSLLDMSWQDENQDQEQVMLVNNPQKYFPDPDNDAFAYEVSLTCGTVLVENLLVRFGLADYINPDQAFNFEHLVDEEDLLDNDDESESKEEEKQEQEQDEEQYEVPEPEPEHLVQVPSVNEVTMANNPVRNPFPTTLAGDFPGFLVMQPNAEESPIPDFATKLPREVIWWQDRQSQIVFRFYIDTLFDTRPEQTFVQVQSKTLDWSYLDSSIAGEVVLYQGPSMNLFSHVVPSGTVVKCQGNYVQVELKKAMAIGWPIRPCRDLESGQPIKFSWLKHQYQDDDESSDEDNTSHPFLDLQQRSSSPSKYAHLGPELEDSATDEDGSNELDDEEEEELYLKDRPLITNPDYVG